MGLEDTVVLPKRRVLAYSELSAGEVFELATTLKVLTAALERGAGAPASTVFFQEYDAASAAAPESLGHFHVHVVARTERDLARNDDVYGFLADHDKDFTRFYKLKLERPNAISEQSLATLHAEAAKVRELVEAESALLRDAAQSL